jgi:hypothetical protein
MIAPDGKITGDRDGTERASKRVHYLTPDCKAVIRVIGGFVYRGTQVPALQGRYVFGDWGSFVAPSARLFFLDPNFVIKELRIGLADRPTGFWLRGFGGALLIGNFGDGRINAFNPSTGAWLGVLEDTTGKAISIEGLWGLTFGNGARGGNIHTLYFTAGIGAGGQTEDHGLFGTLQAAPE